MSNSSIIEGRLTIIKELDDHGAHALQKLESMDRSGCYIGGGRPNYPVGTSINVNGSFKAEEEQFQCIAGHVEGRLRIISEDHEDKIAFAVFTADGVTEHSVGIPTLLGA